MDLRVINAVIVVILIEEGPKCDHRRASAVEFAPEQGSLRSRFSSALLVPIVVSSMSERIDAGAGGTTGRVEIGGLEHADFTGIMRDPKCADVALRCRGLGGHIEGKLPKPVASVRRRSVTAIPSGLSAMRNTRPS